MSSYRDIVTDINANGDEQIYYRDITLEEVEGVISKLKSGKAGGPDTLPPDIFIQSGDNMRTAIHMLFCRSWDEGLLPKVWKSADVKFLRKPGKTNYYSPNSYRPISLTSYPRKIMEMILVNRLEAHLQGNNSMDAEQDGFRKKHSTTHAVLRLIQSIYNGFEKDGFTAAIFIDIKEAYDTVWREGLVYKLHTSGDQGRLFKWIDNFLQNRQARCILDQTTGPTFNTVI